MSKFKFSTTSEMRLVGVHPDLVKVVRTAITESEFDFMVVEGKRSKARQAELVKSGASKTMNSRHLTGHAVDLAPIIVENGKTVIDWNNKAKFKALAELIKSIGKRLNIDVEWGGDWRTFYDGPHFQLSRKSYPDR
ncbi:M15 family metallopeptidase [Gallibacterium anatis]|uniref:Bacteriophage P7 related protein n=1 Tax=Gallibacterium anatis TaxID=750 RepID=A0A1A7P8D5_9PAST|nr:M15 family metallopeptidase [Gallibacterium anatis]OBW97469.1 bacteriophage P7 related protein [Gallibacterium anatis]OBX00872.1 bacteriophage P7 related protein [Gallibacterium anatis]